MHRLSAILLGAGESRRMGMNKLSLPWGKRTVLEHCLHVLLRSKVDEVLLIVNKETLKQARPLIGPRVKLVHNPQYRKGMSTSIQKGLRAMARKSRAFLIALGDHPLLKASTVNALIRAYERKKGTIIVPIFRGERGHPVLFDRRYEKELLKLKKKDVGGRSVLERHREQVYELPTKSEGVVVDIDTWKEYWDRAPRSSWISPHRRKVSRFKSERP